MPEEDEGRRSSSEFASMERLVKEGTLVVFEIPTSLRIPGDGCDQMSIWAFCGAVGELSERL